MDKANALVRKYVKEQWNKYIKPLNHDPVRFELGLDLCSKRCVPIQYGEFEDALTKLLVNSMAAISGVEDEGMIDIVKSLDLWFTNPPGHIYIRTKDLNTSTVIDVEDDGCGIHPKEVYDKMKKRNPSVPPMEDLDYYEILNSIYQEGFSTKAGSAGEGLSKAKKNVEQCGGRLHILGTSYLKYGERVHYTRRDYASIGEHHRKTTGTIIRIEFPL